MHDLLEEYESQDAKIATVSVNSPNEVASARGVLYEDFKGMEGVSKCSVFVIE